MRSYLDKKKIKFKDERLNCAINLCALAVDGKKKMDYLIDHLTSETIEVIDSKQHIYGVPTKGKEYVEVLFDDKMDPSYNGMVLFVAILGKNEYYNYGFRLSRFHNKMIGDFDVCSCDKYQLIYDADGELIDKKLINSQTLTFSVGEQGRNVITTSWGSTKIINKKEIKINYEILFEEFRKNLKDRNYYQSLDREVYRLYYPNKYKFYELKTQKEIAKYFEEVYAIKDSIFDLGNTDDENSFSIDSQVNIVNRKLEDVTIESLVKNYTSYTKWISEKGMEAYSPVCYDDWIEDKGVSLDEDNVEMIDGFNGEEERTVFYNPNRFRYEEDEEEEIIKNNKKR